MNATNHIHYLQRHEIDPIKWDACVTAAANGLIYGLSFYLDAITAGQWDGLVLDEYRAVMPLTWNRKFGFYYLYQPFCTPCLGVFGGSQRPPYPPDATSYSVTTTDYPPAATPHFPDATPHLPDATPHLPDATPYPPEFLLSAFLRCIPKKFKFWDIDLNEGNFPASAIGLSSPPAAAVSTHLEIPLAKFLKFTARVNHFLDLNKKKEELEQGYNRLAKRMCKRAETENIEIIRDIGPRDIIEWYHKEYGRRHPHVKTKMYDRLTLCAEKAFTKGLAQTYLALTPGGAIAAFYLILFDKKFVYSALGGSTQEGKALGAFYLLTDAAIKDHTESPRIFRFEGSDIPGIASFNVSFGSFPIHYPHLQMNGLPFPIRLLK
jgi:hypothetical protein